MKKLFTLVLALALVFAIAAPAMAAGMGFDAPAAPPATTYENISVVVTQLNPVAATGMTGYYSAADGEYYAVYNTSIGVVQGTPVRFAIDVTIPGQNSLQNYNAADFTGSLLNIKLANITTATANVVAESKVGTGSFSALTTAQVEASKEYTVPVGAPHATDATTIRVMVTGSVAASGKDATATASIKNGQTTNVSFYRNSKLYTAVLAGNVITVENDTTGAAVAFTRNATTLKIESLTVTDGTLTASNVRLVDGAASFDSATTAAETAAYQAALNEIFGVLGFTWSPSFTLGYFSNANLASLAAQLSAPKTVTWKAYTANLTVTDGTNVPNTGDNMSVIGFVMVGLALLATAAVVVKKVRA